MPKRYLSHLRLVEVAIRLESAINLDALSREPTKGKWKNQHLMSYILTFFFPFQNLYALKKHIRGQATHTHTYTANQKKAHYRLCCGRSRLFLLFQFFFLARSQEDLDIAFRYAAAIVGLKTTHTGILTLFNHGTILYHYFFFFDIGGFYFILFSSFCIEIKISGVLGKSQPRLE